MLSTRSSFLTCLGLISFSSYLRTFLPNLQSRYPIRSKLHPAFRFYKAVTSTDNYLTSQSTVGSQRPAHVEAQGCDSPFCLNTRRLPASTLTTMSPSHSNATSSATITSSQTGWSTAMALSHCGSTHSPGMKAETMPRRTGVTDNLQFSLQQWLQQDRAAEPWRGHAISNTN